MANKSSLIESLLIPLQDRNLLLPNAAVAEIESMAGLIVESHADDWMLGRIHWRNIRIPVISLETLAGGALKKHSEKARIAILNRAGTDHELSFWGVLVQDTPKLMRLAEKDVVAGDSPVADTEIMSVAVRGEPAVIPDLASVEARMIQAGIAA